MTEAFQAKHKSTKSFLEQLVLLRISKWQLLDADQRARWENDKRSKLVTVLDSSTDVHNLVHKLSDIDLHGSSATPFTRKTFKLDGVLLLFVRPFGSTIVFQTDVRKKLKSPNPESWWTPSRGGPPSTVCDVAG